MGGAAANVVSIHVSHRMNSLLNAAGSTPHPQCPQYTTPLYESPFCNVIVVVRIVRGADCPWSAPTSGGRAKFLGRILGQKLVWGVGRSVVISVFTSGFAVPFCLTVPFPVVSLALPTTWPCKVLGEPRHQSPSNSIAGYAPESPSAQEGL